MYKLIIEDDEGKTTVVPLIRDEITIGRKEGNTIRLTERNVSRRHARLLKQNGALYIEDVNSYNGIKVNGDRIQGRSTVNEGDRIQIGDYQLALKMDKPAEAGAPTAELGDQKTVPYNRENGAPQGALDLPPTVQNAPVSGAQETPARLVIVSSNFAGQEFVLDKAAVVIGRTDENDVVVNHRSISRHHAKIVRENGHYQIIDLQSANGVRVNGEEYSKIELRKGDHVDLGHVRMRFVGPGEDFVFDRDAHVVDVGGGRSKGALVAIVLLLVMVVFGGLYTAYRMGVLGGGGGGDGKTGGDTETQVARLLLEADKAMKAEDWEAAIGKCDEALALDPAQELARDKKTKADLEKKNRTAYTNFENAAEKNDFDSAVASFGEIPEESVYRQKGSEKYASVKRGYLKSHLEQARKAAAAGKCEEARQHVEAALTVDESNVEAQEIIRNCRGGAPVKAPVEHVKPEHTTKPPKPEKPPKAPKPEKQPAPPPDETVKAPSGNDEAIMAKATDAYVHAQYSTAIELAKQALKINPNANQAWRIVGASHCFLKDKAAAAHAFQKLDAQGKNLLKYVCARNQITLP